MIHIDGHEENQIWKELGEVDRINLDMNDYKIEGIDSDGKSYYKFGSLYYELDHKTSRMIRTYAADVLKLFDKTYEWCITLGDPHGDGHGKHDDYVFISNYDANTLHACYDEAVANTGFDPLSIIATDYQDSEIKVEYLKKMNILHWASLHLDDFDKESLDEWEDCPDSFEYHPSLSNEDYINVMLQFIETNSDCKNLIVQSKSENIEGFFSGGYGLYW